MIGYIRHRPIRLDSIRFDRYIFAYTGEKHIDRDAPFLYVYIYTGCHKTITKYKLVKRYRTREYFGKFGMLFLRGHRKQLTYLTLFP